MKRYVWILSIIMIIGIAPTYVLGQGDVEVTIFIDKDSLTIYVPGDQLASVEGLGLQVDTGNGGITRFLEDYTAFRGMPFAALATPICFRLLRNGSSAPLPTDCPSNRVLIQPLADSDIFWYDTVANQARTILLTRRSETLDFCPAGQPSCTLMYNPPTPIIPATPIGSGGQVAFVSDRDGNEEIYLMDANGSNQINITNNINRDMFPSWSQDGTKLAFLSDRDGDWDIYLMNSDGSNVLQITDTDSFEWERVSWSPDGSRIAFIGHYDGDYEIYTMNLDGSDRVQLTDNEVNEGELDWSPDGTKIVFTSENGEMLDIYTINIDGTNLVNLTQSADISEYSPVWSPDGSKIVFYSIFPDKHSDIYIINADGSYTLQLTDEPGADWDSDWSPDGSQLVFQSARDGAWNIYLTNLDGSNQNRLTTDEADDIDPVWQP